MAFCVRCKCEREWLPPAPVQEEHPYLFRGWSCKACGLARQKPGDAL